MANKGKKKKSVKNVTSGKVCIQSTFNNTIVTISDDKGNVISWASAGGCGFKGARKATPYAAQVATQTALEKAKGTGIKYVSITVSGVGNGRESAVRALHSSGLTVTNIKDITPVPHNGCRAKKPRRV